MAPGGLGWRSCCNRDLTTAKAEDKRQPFWFVYIGEFQAGFGGQVKMVLMAVLLHHLWVSGEVYEPLRNRKQRAMPAAA